MLYDCLKPDVYHPTTGNAVASASTVAAVIQTGTLASSSYGGFSPPVAVGSLTVNNYGYVSLVFGQTANPVSGFYLLNKDGEGEEDGVGAEYVVNSLVGPNAEALPPRVAAAAHSAARPPTTVLDPP
jgi:hypothetical protein